MNLSDVKLKRVGGRTCVRRQEMLTEPGGKVAHVKRGRPVCEWVPVWNLGEEFVGCECKGGDPKDRCDLRWMRCNGRHNEQIRRIEAILAYVDPDAKPAKARRAK